jgi:hypothetical protein
MERPRFGTLPGLVDAVVRNFTSRILKMYRQFTCRPRGHRLFANFPGGTAYGIIPIPSPGALAFDGIPHD